MGKALIRREVGDEITVQRPKGEAAYEIIAVESGRDTTPR
jgi:transcription elongation GreA/GreB family factor